MWLKSLETIIEGQTEKVSQRLYYLGKYTAGEPKEAISGLLLMETAEAYKQAKRILSDRFGNPFLIADAYPPFSVFCCFLQRESRIACNPVTTVKQKEVSREDPDKERKTNGFRRRIHKDKVNAFATESHEMANSNGQNRKERKSEAPPCPLCKAAHDLDVCKLFLKKSLTERRDLIKANALCLGCLRWGHMK